MSSVPEAGMCNECQCHGPTRVCVCGMVRYCGVVCQKGHWKSHKQDCLLVVMKVVDGKGMGLVSTRKIKAGKVILRESPIIKHVGWVENLHKFLDQFQELSVEQKMKYVSLHDPGDVSKVVNKEMLEKVEDIGEEAVAMFKVWRILWANGVYIGDKEGAKEKGVYHIISRINHSCKANVVFGLEEVGSDRMIITTCREMAKNDEFVLNYIGAESIFNTKEERQGELAENWYFSCKCEVCSLTGLEFDQNEETRKKIKVCKERIRSLCDPTLKVTQNAFALGMEKLGLMEKIKDEVLVAFPFALMDCYGQTKIIQFFGGEVNIKAEIFRDRAMEMSSLLGPSTKSVCREVEEETEKIIMKWKEVTRKL